MTNEVLYSVENHIARIVVNRPQNLNAQSRKLLERLDEVFADAANDPQVRVIVLFGEGDHFSAGHDLGSKQEIKDRESRPIEPGLRGRYAHSREQYVEKSMRWRNVPKPTIAGIQGFCIYGGWILASSMDVIFAEENAMFLASNFQFFSVPWDLHPRKAKELLYESRFIDAKEACDLGLVNRVVADGTVREEVLAYAERIAQNDPFQLRMMKMAVNQAQDSQGFQAHINAAHLMHMMSAEGERDPNYALQQPDKKRRPMVERAMENFRNKPTKDSS